MRDNYGGDNTDDDDDIQDYFEEEYYEINQTEYNKIKMQIRKIILSKTKKKALELFMGYTLSTLPFIKRELLWDVLVLASRDWEKINKKRLADLLYANPIDRIEGFREILRICFDYLNKCVDNKITTVEELIEIVILNYKTMLEYEGYSVL